MKEEHHNLTFSPSIHLFYSSSIMREYPQVVLKVGHQVVKKLSSFVRQTDFALDWMQLEAGKAVYR